MGRTRVASQHQHETERKNARHGEWLRLWCSGLGVRVRCRRIGRASMLIYSAASTEMRWQQVWHRSQTESHGRDLCTWSSRRGPRHRPTSR